MIAPNALTRGVLDEIRHALRRNKVRRGDYIKQISDLVLNTDDPRARPSILLRMAEKLRTGPEEATLEELVLLTSAAGLELHVQLIQKKGKDDGGEHRTSRGHPKTKSETHKRSTARVRRKET